MVIRYYSAIEKPRVYGFLLRFHCMPTASTLPRNKIVTTIDHSDQDCFIEDNAIEQRSTKQSRSWRSPVNGNRHNKKMTDSRKTINKFPHAETLMQSRFDDQLFEETMSNKLNHWDMR